MCIKRLFSSVLLAVLVIASGFLTANAQQADCLERLSPLRLFEAHEGHRFGSVTRDQNNTVGLHVNHVAFDELRNLNYHVLTIEVPFFNGTHLELDLERFTVYSETFRIGRSRSADHFIEEIYHPKLRTFRITNPGMSGTVVVMQDHVMASFQWRGRQYEISAAGNQALGEHVLFLVDDAETPATFTCGVDDHLQTLDKSAYGTAHSNGLSSGSACVELAIDIDFFTLTGFNGNCYTAIEWALAMVAGVNTIYTNDLNGLIDLQIVYIHTWEFQDPYAALVEDAVGILEELQWTWLNNPDLSAVQWDLVHLLSFRQNTGTGGIAYLNVVCNGFFGFGYSSYLTSQTVYDLSVYSWNMLVLAHEFGHNFGSRHTHWCGWPNGPIDNCVDVEGGCANNPMAQIGTIMSYCHVPQGGGTVLNFHPTVIENALIPTISSGGWCHTSCSDLVSPCGVFGCTDQLACNFNPLADFDNGSCLFVDPCSDPDACNYQELIGCNGDCTYAEEFYDCTGICINDADGDGICDELEIFGCTDPVACNFSTLVTEEDGSCEYLAAYEISGELDIDPFQIQNYSYTGGTGNYAWTVEGGVMITGQGTGGIEVVWTNQPPWLICVQEVGLSGCLGGPVCLELALSLNEQPVLHTEVRVYPNPGSQLMHVQSSVQVREVRVYNLLGALTLIANENTLDVQGLAPGMYVVEVVTVVGSSRHAYIKS